MRFLKNRAYVTLKVTKIIDSKNGVRILGFIPFNNEKVRLCIKSSKLKLSNIDLKVDGVYDIEGIITNDKFFYYGEVYSTSIDAIKINVNNGADFFNQIHLICNLKGLGEGGETRKGNPFIKGNVEFPNPILQGTNLEITFWGKTTEVVKKYSKDSLIHIESFIRSEVIDDNIGYRLSPYRVTSLAS